LSGSSRNWRGQKASPRRGWITFARCSRLEESQKPQTTKGSGHCDLCRFDQDWEVKICKDSGLTINQSKVINGESYIVVNYKANSLVKSIWVLWNAEDRFFSPRLKNSNARSLNREAARDHIEVVFEAKPVRS
jgi:hypothetical protein